MNNQKQLIIYKAIDSLQKTIQSDIDWKQNNRPGLDGTLSLKFSNEISVYNVVIKEELRNQALLQVFKLNEEFKPLILVAKRLSTSIKKQLQVHNVAYLEANGNFFLRDIDKIFWIDTNAPLKLEKDNRSRSFTKTGLKVVFELLRNPELINQTYRQIVEQTGTSVGNITNILQGLKQENFVLSVNKKTLKLTNIEGLMNKWAVSFAETLKPSLFMGTFRFVKQDDLLTWKNLHLDTTKTLWGGEPAGDLLTNYLHPAEFTLYTDESRSEIIKNYKLIPDDNGNIKLYQKFWVDNNSTQQTAPALIVYADLLEKSDRRCVETAQKIYDEYL